MKAAKLGESPEANPNTPLMHNDIIRDTLRPAMSAQVPQKYPPN